MQAFEAYRTQRDAPMPRVDVIITAFRKILGWLARAEEAMKSGDDDTATSLLARSQTVIASLASGVAESTDEPATTFLRLYEFATHCLARREVNDIAAARKILQILLEGFELSRDQAVMLEAQGQIPEMGMAHSMEMTV